jgi:hypothetical protein
MSTEPNQTELRWQKVQQWRCIVTPHHSYLIEELNGRWSAFYNEWNEDEHGHTCHVVAMDAPSHESVAQKVVEHFNEKADFFNAYNAKLKEAQEAYQADVPQS